MKKILLASAAISLLMACSKKDIHKWLGKPGNPKPPALCKVDSIYPVETGGDPAAVSWTAVGIHYNDKGNPAVLNYNIQGFFYIAPKFPVYYKYDNKNRLTEITAPYVDPVDIPTHRTRINYRHKFVYEGNSQLPVRDTIKSDTFFGIADGTPYKVFSVKVEDLFYDHKGRVNRIVHRGWFENTQFDHKETFSYEVKYAYDANGNRQTIDDGSGTTPPAITYSNKPSLYSLHPVWQLVHRNWSKNAVDMYVETYNSNGLPTRGDLSKAEFLGAYSAGSGNSMLNVDYTCL